MASGGVRQASFEKKKIVFRSFLSATGHTNTLFEYPLEKPFEAKLVEELVCLMSLFSKN